VQYSAILFDLKNLTKRGFGDDLIGLHLPGFWLWRSPRLTEAVCSRTMVSWHIKRDKARVETDGTRTLKCWESSSLAASLPSRGAFFAVSMERHGALGKTLVSGVTGRSSR
jgi:hypothetical protein